MVVQAEAGQFSEEPAATLRAIADSGRTALGELDAAEAADGRQFLDGVRGDGRIDVALVDIRMPVLTARGST